MANAYFVCSECGVREPLDTRRPRCACGGLWRLDHTPPAFDESLIDKSQWNIFRYRRFMPIEGETWRGVTLGEGMTPVVRYDDDLTLKMDYFMPTLSFKDRGAAVLVAHCKAIGVTRAAQDSSGNAGNSVAAYCARSGIACEIFVPEGASPGKIGMIRAHGAVARVVPGNRDHCADVCRQKVENEGVYYANHVYNPLFFEGTKTYVYEVYEQLGRVPSNIFVPLGNGTLFLGVVRGLEHLLRGGAIARMPNVVAVQSERCAPFARAMRLGLRDPAEANPGPTLAEGIAIGRPARGREILQIIRRYGMEIVEIPEDDILPARAELARKGIYCEHTAAAGLAAYRKYCRLRGRTPDSLLTMSGAGLKSDH